MRICTIEGCGNRHNARGLCRTHYGMLIKHGDALYADKGLHIPSLGSKPNTADNFWERVNKTDHCWLWTRGKDKNGYGLFPYKNKLVRATRFLAAEVMGWQIEGMEVCHTCDNPSCVRPDHLFVGTPLDNARDRESKGRGTKGRPHSPERTAKRAAARRGKKWTPEMRARASRTHKELWKRRKAESLFTELT